MQINKLNNRLEVWKWLQKNGWQISKAGFYSHCSDGKLTPDTNGEYLLSSIQKYAKTYLRRKSTGKKVAEQQKELQEQKLKAEIKRLNAQAAKAEHELMVAEGKYVLRDELDMELVGRATILNVNLSNWITNNAAEWIQTVDGDITKISSLIAQAMDGKDQALNDFAAHSQYNVEI